MVMIISAILFYREFISFQFFRLTTIETFDDSFGTILNNHFSILWLFIMLPFFRLYVQVIKCALSFTHISDQSCNICVFVVFQGCNLP